MTINIISINIKIINIISIHIITINIISIHIMTINIITIHTMTINIILIHIISINISIHIKIIYTIQSINTLCHENYSWHCGVHVNSYLSWQYISIDVKWIIIYHNNKYHINTYHNNKYHNNTYHDYKYHINIYHDNKYISTYQDNIHNTVNKYSLSWKLFMALWCTRE